MMDGAILLDGLSGSVDLHVQYILVQMIYSICSTIDPHTSIICDIYSKDLGDEYDIQILIPDYAGMDMFRIPSTIESTFRGSKCLIDPRIPPKYTDVLKDVLKKQKVDFNIGMIPPSVDITTYIKMGVICKSGTDCWFVMTPNSIVPRVIYFKVTP